MITSAVSEKKVTVGIKVFRAKTNTWEDHGIVEGETTPLFWKWLRSICGAS